MVEQYKIRSIRPRIQMWNDFFVGKDITNSLLSVETNKSVNDIAGTFTIQLRPNEGMFGKNSDWFYDRFDPQDVIGITFDTAGNKDEKGKDKGSQFLGIVDVPQKSNKYSDENPSRTVSISGRDFGSLLLDDDLINIREIFLQPKENGVPAGLEGETSKIGKNYFISPAYNGIEKDIAEKLRGRHPCFTPECLVGIGPVFSTAAPVFSFMDAPVIDAIKFIMDNTTSIRNLVYIAPKGETEKTLVHNLINYQDYVVQRPEYVCMQTAALSSYQGNLLNFIRQVLDADFNELMVDTKDGVSYLRVRPKPFDRVGDSVNQQIIANDDPFCWDNLKTFVSDKDYHVIEKTEIIELNLHRSKNRAYSVFRITPGALNDFNELYGFTLNRSAVDLYNMLRYGFKKIESDVHVTYAGHVDIIDQLFIECRDRLKNWNIYCPIFEEGTIVIRGREDIHIGDKIYLPWYKREYISKEKSYTIEDITVGDGYEFYVTGVKNRWEIGSAYITTLTLDRGLNKKILAEYIDERKRTLEYISNNVENLYKKMSQFEEW